MSTVTEEQLVVDHAFAFQHGHDSSRDSQTLAVALAATASVGETIAPRTKATDHGSPTTLCAATAIVVVVTSTSPIASSKIG